MYIHINFRVCVSVYNLLKRREKKFKHRPPRNMLEKIFRFIYHKNFVYTKIYIK